MSQQSNATQLHWDYRRKGKIIWKNANLWQIWGEEADSAGGSKLKVKRVLWDLRRHCLFVFRRTPQSKTLQHWLWTKAQSQVKPHLPKGPQNALIWGHDVKRFTGLLMSPLNLCKEQNTDKIKTNTQASMNYSRKQPAGTVSWMKMTVCQLLDHFLNGLLFNFTIYQK